MEIYEVLSEIARWLRIPPNWLSLPEVITYVLIPFILAGLGFSYMFEFIFIRAGIFRKFRTIKWIFGFGIAFYALPLGSVLGLAGGTMIAFFKFYQWKWRIIVFILFLILYFFILPYITNLLMNRI